MKEEKDFKIYYIKIRIVNKSKKLDERESETGLIEADGNKITITISKVDGVINLAHELGHFIEYYYSKKFGSEELADKFEDAARQWWRDFHREKTIEFKKDKSDSSDIEVYKTELSKVNKSGKVDLDKNKSGKVDARIDTKVDE